MSIYVSFICSFFVLCFVLFDGVGLCCVLVEVVCKFLLMYLVCSLVMVVVMVGMIVVVIVILIGNVLLGFGLVVIVILLVIVLFGNFVEVVVEVCGCGQVVLLCCVCQDLVVWCLVVLQLGVVEVQVFVVELCLGDYVIVSVGELVLVDGEIVQGLVIINEVVVIGEFVLVLCEVGIDCFGVIGGIKVLFDQIIVWVIVELGYSFLDWMIVLVEGVNCQKMLNEIVLILLLVVMMLIFLVVVVMLLVIGVVVGVQVDLLLLIVLLVCLILIIIGGLLLVIGIVGMNCVLVVNVLVKLGKVVEVVGDVDVLLLDKIGIIIYGDCQVSYFYLLVGIDVSQLCEVVLLFLLVDLILEGKLIVCLVCEQGCVIVELDYVEYLVFSVQICMFGVDLEYGWQICKGVVDVICVYVQVLGGNVLVELVGCVEQVVCNGVILLVVVEGCYVLGVIELLDVVKYGMCEKFVQLWVMGICMVMIIGDNLLMVVVIVVEVGVDDYIVEVCLEDKLVCICQEQVGGWLVVMVGDGINDVLVLVQVDIGLVMNFGMQVVKEVGNMVDFDLDLVKLLVVVEVGKQQLIIRGVLIIFLLVNDVFKYFVILLVLFVVVVLIMVVLNVMQLLSLCNVVLVVLIFNVLVIFVLILFVLCGVCFCLVIVIVLLCWNMLVYGFGGVLLLFVVIKLIDFFFVLVFGV